MCQFPDVQPTTAYGRGCRCDRCHAGVNKSAALYRNRNRSRINAYRLAWRSKNKGIDRRQYLRQEYGLTVDDYQHILEAQDGRCAICGSQQKSRLVIDHCHKSEKIRGLLCHRCNLGLGYFLDTPTLLTSAIQYLKRGEV